jgi:hypothetical protein
LDSDRDSSDGQDETIVVLKPLLLSMEQAAKISFGSVTPVF